MLSRVRALLQGLLLRVLGPERGEAERLCHADMGARIKLLSPSICPQIPCSLPLPRGVCQPVPVPPHPCWRKSGCQPVPARLSLPRLKVTHRILCSYIAFMDTCWGHQIRLRESPCKLPIKAFVYKVKIDVWKSTESWEQLTALKRRAQLVLQSILFSVKYSWLKKLERTLKEILDKGHSHKINMHYGPKNIWRIKVLKKSW